MNKRKLLILPVLFAVYFQAEAQKNPCNPTGAPYKSLPGDTTIKLPSGSTVTMNRCEFFDLRDCLEIVEITNAEDLQREGLNMYDKDGNILITCGMIKVDLKNCGKKCFEVPIKLKIKVRFQDCSGVTDAIPRIYLNNGGGWEEPTDKKGKVTPVNNDRFIEFETNCAVFINCDVPKKGRKAKFIAPKGNKVHQFRLGINCPLFYYDENPSVPKRKIKVRLLCVDPARMMIQTVQTNRNNDSVGTGPVSLSTLKHGKSRMGCKRPKRSFFNTLFGWLSPSKGRVHKRYFLPPS